MAQIKSGASSDLLTIDPVSKAGRTSPYDASGTSMVPAARTALPATAGGVLLAGNQYKLSRALRTDETGTLRTSDESLMLYDSSEGAAVNTNTWVQTTATMTITQAAATGVLLNAGSTLTTTTGAMHVSHRQFPRFMGAPLIYRARVRATAHFANNVHELGFGAPSSSTAATATNGAHWRKDTSGQWLPVIVINSVEILGTPISNATFVAAVPATDYCIFTVEIQDAFARFCIFTQSGALVTAQDIDFTQGTSVTDFAVTHLQAFYRNYNAGAVATAVQLFVKNCMVTQLDALSQRDYLTSMSGMGFNSTQSPTAYTQTANYTNGVAPTARTLSNTAAGETTLGGLIRANAMAGAATDLIMFGFQVPSPYTFYFTGIRIPAPLNEVAAVATTDTLFTYFMAFNSSAVSLATAAPYAPRFVALGGVHRGAVALAANQQFSGADIIWQPKTPIAVFPGRFLHIGCRALVGTATATETFQWGVAVEGYFE